MASASPSNYLKEELYAHLRKDDALFEFIQSGSLDGIWYWDITRPENEWMSPEFKRCFGYEDSEVPNNSSWWQENLEPGQLEDIFARFHAHLENPNVPYDQVVSYRHKDGSTVWVRCRGIAIRDDEGTPIRMLGCHTDITQLKLTELKLTQRLKELETANRELEHFASIISHDLQEPLRKITLFGSLLRETIEDDLNDEASHYLHHIEKTSTRMSSLLRAMVHYTRVSYKSVSMEPVDLDNVVKDVLFDLDAAIKESHATITCEPLPVLHAHPMHMHQLCLNLISNALKFRCPDHPPIITISCDPSQPNTFHIQDNGIGFDAHKYGTKIFEPFQRLHTRDAFEGTGIGLAACKKIVDIHQGTITVSSTPDHGTRFTITLPLDETGAHHADEAHRAVDVAHAAQCDVG